MMLIHRFFKLSIHRQSYDKYYERAKLDKEKMMKAMESNWGKPYDEIPRERRIDAEDRCWRPPWALNDIVGYVDVGIDVGVRLSVCLGGCPRIQKVIFLPQYIVRQDIAGHNIMWSEFSNLYCRTAS